MRATTEEPIMRCASRRLRATIPLALAIVTAACGKKTEPADDTGVPDVGAEVPDVATRGGSSDDSDMRELSRYQLTMADLQKLGVAHQNLKRIAQQHPNLVEDEEEEQSGEKSLDEIEAEIERVPQLRKAIEDAGLSVRKYAVINLVLMQASAANMLVQHGAKPDSIAREIGTHPENIRFVREHEAEVARLQRALADTSTRN
jgi:hypothetical protein